MTERTEPDVINASQSGGSLSVRSDGLVSGELNFLVGQQSKRIVPALLTSAALDLLIVLVFVFLSRVVPTSKPTAFLPDLNNDQIVWIAQGGPGGGGGGGGNRAPDPPKVAELPGKDKITVPVVKPPVMELKQEPPPPPPEPVQQVNIPAQELAASTQALPGAIDAPSVPVASTSQGSGSGGGAGTGTGSGIGQGQGSGLGDGFGGGTGGGVYKLGSGIVDPVLVRQVNPKYTSEAMRARVQGEVIVECIVDTDGSVREARVTRSLGFGLDEEALAAARQWRFNPGKRMGQPVRVLISIGLSFSLR